MSSTVYSLHNIVRVSFTKDFSPKFIPEDFKDKKVRKADLVVDECQDVKFNRERYQRIEDFYGGEGKFYFECYKFKLLKYKMLIDDLLGKTTFSFTQTMRVTKVEDFVALIKLLLEVKLLQRGCTLIHGAGVTKNSDGYLISGWGGTGKTSALMSLSREGFKLLGDELVILSKNGAMYSFPTLVDVRASTVNVPKLPIGKRVQGMAKRSISRVSPFELPISPGVGIKLSELGEVGKTGKLDKLFILKKSPTHGCEKMPKETAVKKFVSMNKLEFLGRSFPLKVWTAYCYLNDFDPLFVERQMEAIFRRTFNRCYLVNGEKSQHYKLIMKEVM